MINSRPTRRNRQPENHRLQTDIFDAVTRDTHVPVTVSPTRDNRLTPRWTTRTDRYDSPSPATGPGRSGS